MQPEVLLPEHPPSPPALRSEEEIMATWKSGGPPLVSVICATFNHVGFIEDAVRGFLGQVTTFPFELIIRDDASTDGTTDKLREFAASYPRLLKLLLEENNTYPDQKPFPVLLKASKGKYLAPCEGDDYWIHPKKLELQVKAMERNPSVSLVRTACWDIHDNRVIGFKKFGGTRTYLYRKFEDYPVHRQKHIFFGDTFITSCLSAKGSFYDLPEITAVWRKHPGGVWSSLVDSDNRLLELQRAVTQFWLAEHFIDSGDAKRGEIHLGNSINKLLAAYPKAGYRVKARLLFEWLVPRIFKRARRWLGRIVRKVFRR